MNIEEIFKSSLENSEVPFDPKAWEAMSARLDQAMPVSQAPKSSFKWAWVASVAVVAGLSALFFIGNDDEKTAVSKQQARVSAPANPTSQQVSEDKETHADVQNTPENAVNTVTSAPLKTNANPVSNHTGSTTPATEKSQKTAASAGNSGGSPSSIPVSAPDKDPKKESRTAAFAAPKVNDRYCENEKVTIKNTNEFAISLVSENGFSHMIESGKTWNADLTEAGEYFFAYPKANGKTEKESAFKVIARPRADFYANDETLYKDGLPVNELEALTDAKEYTWMNAKGEVLSREKNADIHLFTKGQHDITLKVENGNGCVSQVTKSVRCEVSYNLLAVTGFNPESTIEDNRTFIPYALLRKQRNIPFEMEIIDPKTGQTIYRTKNADEPWDGTDMNTRQLVPSGASYLWRVTIYKKEPGEPKSAYQGMITRI